MATLIATYQCGACATVRSVVHKQPIPVCCDAPMTWRQLREYKPEQHGWETGEKSAAIGFRHTNPWVVPLEGAGPHGQLEVTGLNQIRAIERETAKREADGVGEALRFRAFSQDVAGGGMLHNTFGAAPKHTPQLFDKHGRQKISIGSVDGETMDLAEMGPGASEALASALGPGMSGDLE